MKLSTLKSLLFLTILSLPSCTPLINKMAFYPDTTDVLSKDQLPEEVEEVYIETSDHLKIHSYFIQNQTTHKILIYFHGNGGNLSHRLPDLMTIHRSGMSVLGVSYRGYGKSEGKPSEKGIYRDGKAALNYAINTLGFPIHQVFIMGRSIGTTVAINISQKKNINGLILITPLTSGKDHAKASGLGLIAFLAGNAFNNIGRITNITSPVLVIHGTQDDVIPFEMGEKIFNKATSEKQFVIIEGANHNNLSSTFAEKYWPPVFKFIKDMSK